MALKGRGGMEHKAVFHSPSLPVAMHRLFRAILPWRSQAPMWREGEYNTKRPSDPPLSPQLPISISKQQVGLTPTCCHNWHRSCHYCTFSSPEEMWQWQSLDRKQCEGLYWLFTACCQERSADAVLPLSWGWGAPGGARATKGGALSLKVPL